MARTVSPDSGTAGATGDARSARAKPIVRRLAETAPAPCPCGAAYRVVQAADGAPASVHFVDIRFDSDRHYHRRLTEIYTCLEGQGFLEIDGQDIPLRPGTVVVIEPGMRHRAYPASPDQPLRILNTVIPPFDPADEWLDGPAPLPAG